jgi:endo-1,4-beta-D-glucanase Y
MPALSSGGSDEGVTVTGQVRSYNPKNATELQLKIGDNVMYETTIDEEDGEGQHTQKFDFTNVAPGTYTLVITKDAHTGFTLTGVVVGEEDLDLRLNGNESISTMTLRGGDLNGSGNINQDDLAILISSANYGRGAVELKYTKSGDPGWVEPDPRKVIVDFEDYTVGAWPHFSTRGSAYPSVSIVADPADPGKKSLQVSVSGWNQAPIVPVHLPYALENYQTVSVRLRMVTGIITGQNFQIFASDSNAESGNFIQHGFGNTPGQANHFDSLRIAASAENGFSNTGWETVTMTLNPGASTRELQGNVFLAIGINFGSSAAFMIDDVTFTLKDSFVLPEPGAVVAAPALESKTARIITVGEVFTGTAQSVEYGISTANTPPAVWQDGRSFAGLIPDTQYFVFARSKANATHRAGPPSGSLSVRTDTEAPHQPVQPGEGAAETGGYRNLLLEMGIATQAEIDSKIEQTWHRIFGCENSGCPINGCNLTTAGGTPAPHNHAFKLYYEVGGDKAYIVDAGNSDVRSEGMSYGLMMAVQMDRKDVFDRLWRWTYDHMYHNRNTNRRGYFAWQVSTNGNIMDSNPAPDGEMFFATALLFASNRWGDGEGALNYGRYGRQILYDMINRQGLTGDHNRPLFNLQNHMPVMSPMGAMQNHTNYSYHLPHFFEIWAEEIEYGADRYQDIWPNEAAALADAQFYREAAAVSRNYFHNLINDPPKPNFPQHGLAPEYSNFDGSAVPGTQSHVGLWVDAWRVAGIIAMDNSWWARDTAFATLHANTMQAWLAQPHLNTRDGRFSYVSAFNLDGTPHPTRALDTSPGFVSNNAVASLSADHALAREFVQHFWEINMTSGQWRYYDGCLYFFSLLSLSGNYRAYYSTGPGTGAILNSRITPTAASFDKAAGKQSGIDVTMRLNGNELVSISNGSTLLIPGADFTRNGDMITIGSDYLAAQPLGTVQLTFVFNQGEIAQRTLNITVDDTSVPVLGHTFEKPVHVQTTGTGVLNPSFPGGDVLRLDKTNGNNSTIGAILPFRLTPGTNLRNDYTHLYLEIRGVSGDLGNKSIIAEARAADTPFAGLGNTLVNQSQNFAAGTWYDLAIPLAAGRAALTGDIQIAFGLNNTTAVTYEVRYIGLAPRGGVIVPGATIDPASAGFDIADPADIDVTLSLNGNTFTGITGLTENTHYTINGNVITIRKEYLAQQDPGTTTLTFTFNQGPDRTLAITISDGGAPPPEVVIRHTFTAPVTGVRVTDTGHVAAPAFTGGFMNVSKTSGHSTHGVIVPFDLGTTRLSDYSRFVLVLIPRSGDLGHKDFHVEVRGGHNAAFSGFGGAAANRLIPTAQRNFTAGTQMTVDVPINRNAAIDTLTGEISIAFGLNNAAAHTYDVVSIELIP